MRIASRVIVAVLAIAVVFLLPSSASAKPTGKTYATPEKAVDAFIAALRKSDEKTLVKIFGKGSETLFHEDDPNADNRIAFLESYDEKHVIANGPNGSKILVTGIPAWPFPIPLVKAGSGWAFDTAAGMEELINRRIGRNELQTIQTCLILVDAQREYYSRDRDGDGILEFAQATVSTVGLQNGLFWRTEEGDPPSPLSEFVAGALAQGYTSQSTSYYGYKFKPLTGQGPAAPGGAYEYLARDNQIGGFAFLAYPVDYGDVGVMSFMVNHEGVMYQRDLGDQTLAEVAKITTFDPVEGWVRVPDEALVPIPND